MALARRVGGPRPAGVGNGGGDDFTNTYNWTNYADGFSKMAITATVPAQHQDNHPQQQQPVTEDFTM